MTEEHRRSDRHSIERMVRYHAVDSSGATQEGFGHTVNISVTGVAFTTWQTLPAGSPVELIIHCPPTLDGSRVKLRAWGNVVRSSENVAAIETANYEFQTME